MLETIHLSHDVKVQKHKQHFDLRVILTLFSAVAKILVATDQ